AGNTGKTRLFGSRQSSSNHDASASAIRTDSPGPDGAGDSAWHSHGDAELYLSHQQQDQASGRRKGGEVRVSLRNTRRLTAVQMPWLCSANNCSMAASISLSVNWLLGLLP